MRHAIEQGDVARLEDVVHIVRRSGALEATRQTAAAQARLAEISLQILPEGRYKQALVELASQSVSRQS